MANLKVIAVDVEACCGEWVSWKASTPYKKGAQIMDPANNIQRVTVAGTSGSTPPTWNDAKGGATPGDGTVTWRDTGNIVLQANPCGAPCIAYISNAVNYINTTYPSLNVAIYTSNGSDKNWRTITGNCGTGSTNNCSALISLPLWDVEHKHFYAGDGTQHCGDGVAGLVPWTTPFGSTGWQTRSGNQYDWGLYTPAALPLEENGDPEAKPARGCGSEPFFGLSAVDLDYFNPALFSPTGSQNK
jgi:hypothetical protein